MLLPLRGPLLCKVKESVHASLECLEVSLHLLPLLPLVPELTAQALTLC